ncbi:MAG: type II secretion system F family protein [Hyphomicrobiales bacterium]
MFGPTVTLMALAMLAAFSVGGVAWVFLYPYLTGEIEGERRMAKVADTPVKKAKADKGPTRREVVSERLQNKEKREQHKQSKGKSESAPLSLKIERAGLKWSQRQFVLISAAFGLGTTAVAMIFDVPIYLAAGIGFVGGFGMPRWYVSMRTKRRLRKFIDEFPNTVDVIVRGVKAGLPLNDCLRIIGRESPSVIVREEFGKIIETQKMGIPLADAIGQLYDRVPLPEANFFAIVIAIQQKAGGNLSEALGNLSGVLRDRKKMAGKVRAVSQEAKASAAIIGALPVVVMLLIYFTSPDYITLLFSTSVGNAMLVGCVFWMLCGILVMRKMINFDF